MFGEAVVDQAKPRFGADGFRCLSTYSYVLKRRSLYLISNVVLLRFEVDPLLVALMLGHLKLRAARCTLKLIYRKAIYAVIYKFYI